MTPMRHRRFLARRVPRPVVAALAAVCLALAGVPSVQAADAGYVFEREWAFGSDQIASGAAVAPDGKVYVVTFLIGDEHSMHVYSPSGVQLATWSVEPGGSLGGMDVGPDGNLHVAQFAPEEGLDGKVLVYSPTGQLLRTYKVPGTPSNSNPKDVAVAPDGYSYIVDYNDDVVSRFSPDGSFLGSWGTPGAGPSEFLTPSSIAAAADGTVYVVDEDNSQVKQFTGTGLFIRSWGQSGYQPGQLTDPSHVEVGPDGHVYVIDDVDRIQEFTADGHFVAVHAKDQIAQAQLFALDASASLYVPGRLASTSYTLSGVSKFVRAGQPTTGEPAIASKQLNAKKGKIGLKVACATGGECAGKMKIRRKKSVVAKGSYSVAGGATEVERAKLTRQGKKLLAKHRKTKVDVVLVAADGGTVKATLRLKR